MIGIKQKKLIVVLYIIFFISIIPVLAFAWSIPDTGQNVSYTNTFGEDSDYRINPLSFTKLDENGVPLPETATSWAMVKDNVTGLLWEAKTNADSGVNYLNPHDADNRYRWYGGTECGYVNDFISLINSSNYCGLSNWRLPTMKEIGFIINRQRINPCLDINFFPNTNKQYWSSTRYSNDTSGTWGIEVGTGYVGTYDETNCANIYAVSGEPFSNNFKDNGNGTVTDNSTGLTWQKEGLTSKSWEDSLSYCRTLSLAGYEDWRLPNINELLSIVEYNRKRPSIDLGYFPNTSPSKYWSSTSVSYNSSVWVIDFDSNVS